LHEEKKKWDRTDKGKRRETEGSVISQKNIGPWGNFGKKTEKLAGGKTLTAQKKKGEGKIGTYHIQRKGKGWGIHLKEGGNMESSY